MWAIACTSSSDLNFVNLGIAPLTFLTYFSVDFQLVLELASLMVRRKGSESGSFSLNRSVYDLLRIHTEGFDFWIFKLIAKPQRIDPRLVQSFIDIDIP
jgi:hypothetical protein